MMMMMMMTMMMMMFDVQYTIPTASFVSFYIVQLLPVYEWRCSAHAKCITSTEKTRQALCVCRDNEACSYSHSCCGRAISIKARLHGFPRQINAVETTKFNSTAERYCLHSSTKVNEAVDFKMAANELVREGGVVMCDCLMKECQQCQHILEKRNK